MNACTQRKLIRALIVGVSALGSAAAQTATASHGIALSNMDLSMRPGDDFFHFSNGGYIAHASLPADRARIGLFITLTEQSTERVQGIVRDAAKANDQAGAQKDPELRKIADLYQSYMDRTASHP